MLLNYKYEIFPNEEQKLTWNYWLFLCRHTYNSGLLDRSNAYKNRKDNINRYDLQRIQTADKKKHAFLRDMPSQPLQEVFLRLEKAYKKFFSKDGGYPKLKKEKDYNSFTFTQFGIEKRLNKISDKRNTVRHAISFGKKGCLLISKLGEVKIEVHRKLVGKVKQVVIKRQGQRWFAIFSVEGQVSHQNVDKNNTVGIDVGLKSFAVLSTGETIDNPRYLRKSEKILSKKQRQLSKMNLGSKNWCKQLLKVQKIHTHIANQRKDFLHRKSFKLSQKFSIVFVEDLKISHMVRNRKFSKVIYDVGWGMFCNFLNYKTIKFGGILRKVKPHFTTQDCSSCGNRVKKSLSIRTHVCIQCGTVLDRDHNSAINIQQNGLLLL